MGAAFDPVGAGSWSVVVERGCSEALFGSTQDVFHLGGCGEVLYVPVAVAWKAPAGAGTTTTSTSTSSTTSTVGPTTSRSGG